MTNPTLEKCYVIKDSNGRFEGSLSIGSNNIETSRGNWKWDYFSEAFPTSWNLSRENTEIKLNRLKELNELARYNLTWEIVEFTEQEIFGLAQKGLSLRFNNSSIVTKEIKHGCISKHRKAVKDICNKKVS